MEQYAHQDDIRYMYHKNYYREIHTVLYNHYRSNQNKHSHTICFHFHNTYILIVIVETVKKKVNTIELKCGYIHYGNK